MVHPLLTGTTVDIATLEGAVYDTSGLRDRIHNEDTGYASVAMTQRYQRGDSVHGLSLVTHNNSYFWEKVYFSSATATPGVTVSTSEITVVSVFPDSKISDGKVWEEELNLYSDSQDCGVYNVADELTVAPWFVEGTKRDLNPNSMSSP